MGHIFGRTRPRFLSFLSLSFGLWIVSVALVRADDSQPSAANAGAPKPPEQTQCIDEAIRDELNARRRYRGVQSRLFQKAGRHELSGFGGLYASDLLSSSYLVGGAYTFHFSEDLGLEASFGYARANSSLVQIVQNDTSFTALRLNTPIYIYEGHLLWSLAYGKVRWFGSGISRFDLYLAFGGGVTDNQSAQGLTGSFGLGFKLYFGEWFAIRIDVRDQLLQQELLGQSEIVNNLAATLGFSIFFPFSA